MTRAGVKPAWLLGLLLLAATPTDAWAHGGVPAEIAALDAKLEGDTTDAERAARLTERASLYVRRRDFAAAFADLNEAYDLAPEHAAILYERGRLFAAVDLATAAEWDLSGFLALEPRHVKARLARARVREGAGHIADARADYAAAFAVEPSLDASLGLGGLERKAGDLDAAAAAYERGLDALGDALALRVALVEVETERRHYDRALEL
ncbi:MAG: hypothetical protein KC731_24625, partial [Myxococcales bacterium]|nr:hypothetical protein [Myxococcales bacterium]